MIRQFSRNLGFHHIGIARAVKLEEDARRLETWLQKGMHGQMQYMENYFEQRVDPRVLVPGARTVITLLLNYFPEEQQPGNQPLIAKYAYGKDYHEVIRNKLGALLSKIREEVGDIQGRGFVDSAPVLERTWAKRSGLGWIGKNGNLINKKAGSFFFIATLITDLELEYDDPFAKDYCGTCTKCIDACPTEAILPGNMVNGSKCISYFTIELKDEMIPSEMKGKFNNWAFGCDICQDVCPWNRFSTPTEEAAFRALPEILNLSTEEWEKMSEEGFKRVFKDSPIKRTKYGGMMRNIKFIKS